MTRAFRIDALSDALGIELFAHPVDDEAESPFAEEREQARAFGPLRGPHFTGGRLAAHAALLALGVTPTSLPREESGAVRWPRGLVGAISHTQGLAVAALGPSSSFTGVGVDIEPMGRTLDDSTRRILAQSDDERAWLDTPPPLPAAPLLLLASAKEVVFKACFPPSSVRLRFEDASVTPSPRGFCARVHREAPGLPPSLDVELALVGGYVVLAGVIPRVR